jgi:hypothetical protein
VHRTRRAQGEADLVDGDIDIEGVKVGLDVDSGIGQRFFVGEGGTGEQTGLADAKRNSHWPKRPTHRKADPAGGQIDGDE